jgi:hypothetical protein
MQFGIADPSPPEAADRDIERVDVETDDCCLFEITAQGEDFLTGCAAERENAKISTISNLLKHMLEDLWIAVLRCSSVGLVETLRRSQQ